MKQLRLLVFLFMFAGLAPASMAAEVRRITLDEAILTARSHSVDAAVALNELRTAYWTYRTYRAELLPEINFSATAPGYRKSYSSHQLDDGSFTFVRNNYMEMNGEISVDQNIWLTGGTLSLNTSIDYLKQLTGTRHNRFMSIPVALTLSQPIFGVNTIKWDRRIEPVRYAEAKAAFISATENVAMTAINYYFSLLLSKENISIARQNLANAQKLYEVAKAKREMGQINKNDLLQL
ncbi:MAG: TolC family protein, partial [Duncaniella sp.]|nr:TolC family protein [Duncaniella sp.]